jgi:hypothetical protein
MFQCAGPLEKDLEENGYGLIETPSRKLSGVTEENQEILQSG